MEETNNTPETHIKAADIVLQKSTLTRRERREAEIYQPVLLKLVQEYFKSREETDSLLIEEHVFKSLNTEWVNYVNDWNKRHKKYVTKLRDTDFFNFVNSILRKEANGTKG